jgi:hypothetical protein
MIARAIARISDGSAHLLVSWFQSPPFAWASKGASALPEEYRSQPIRRHHAPSLGRQTPARVLIRIQYGYWARHDVGRTFGIFGEPRVNVLELNLDLQNTHPAAGHTH